MRWARTRTPMAVGLAGLLSSLAALSGCSSPAPRASSSAPPGVAVPLDAAAATPTGEVAVVAMGTLGDPLETFWQVFFRASSAVRWGVVTPPGVADNGGIVVSASPGPKGMSLLAGFEPSQDLGFSPLALSTDHGGSWVPGLVPGALAAVPDALSNSSDSGAVALLRGRGGEVLRSKGGEGSPSTWSPLGVHGSIASSAAGRSCGVGDLTGVALDATRGALVGTSCTSPGVVGIFGSTGTTWRLLGPRLSGRPGSEPTKVLRLVEVNGVPSALVAVGTRATTSLVAMTSSASGSWSRSEPLPMEPGGRLVSTGVESGGGFVVLTSQSDGTLALDIETGPGGAWHPAPAPPRGTATVVDGANGAVDALTVASTRLTDWRLAPAGTWIKAGVVTVPIQFGSSS